MVPINGSRTLGVLKIHLGFKSLQQDSNLRPTDYDSAALPTELWRLEKSILRYLARVYHCTKRPSIRGVVINESSLVNSIYPQGVTSPMTADIFSLAYDLC